MQIVGYPFKVKVMSVLRCGLCSSLTEEILAKLNDQGIRSVTDLITKDLEEVSLHSKLPYKVKQLSV